MTDILPWWATFACAGFAACTAEVATLPIDTAKVRLQLLQKSKDASTTSTLTSTSSSISSSVVLPKRLGMIGMMRQIQAQEGTSALYKGFWPAIQRQLVFASLRIGVYKQITDMFKAPGETTISLGKKIISGLAAGAIGIAVANPTDLVKVRMQSEGRLLPGQLPRYTGVLNAYSTIIRSEGVLGLWTGLGPAIMRNSIINATELVSYETTKEYLLSPTGLGMKDGLPAHFTAGAAAGLMATIVGNPVDVVKTRVMASKRAIDAVKGSSSSVNGAGGGGGGGGAIVYNGAVDCIVKTLRHEGPMAFYQGVVPQFYRLTGWSIVMFVTFEKVKAFVAKGIEK